MTASVFLAMQLTLTAADGSVVASDLRPPVPVLVSGKPLDVEHEGQAAPFIADFDGDGKKDLLVGEAYKGRLRILSKRRHKSRAAVRELQHLSGRSARRPNLVQLHWIWS